MATDGPTEALLRDHHAINIREPEKGGVLQEIKAASLSLMSFHVLVILLFGLFTKYHDTPGSPTGAGPVYELYKDVAVMIFIGFGYLMTFLKKYGYGAVGFTFLLSAIVIEFGMLNVRPHARLPLRCCTSSRRRLLSG